MLESSIFDALDDIDAFNVSPEVLANCSSEDEYVGFAVSLLVETGSYCCVAANTLGDQPKWDRDKAAIGGNVVRLYKLISAMLDKQCNIGSKRALFLVG